MQMTMGRWAFALGLSLAVHLTGVAVWSGSSPETEDERAAGALAQVAVALSPSQFYPSVAAQETSVEELEDAIATKARPVLEPLQTVTVTRAAQTAKPSLLKTMAEMPTRPTQDPGQGAKRPSASAPNMASVEAEAVTAPITMPKAPSIDQGSSIGPASPPTKESQEAVQAEPLKQRVEQKVAAIAKTTPVEQVVEAETVQPNEPVAKAKRIKKQPDKKKLRKAKQNKGKSSKEARRAKAASSARKGTARRNAGDGGRSNRAAGRAKLSSYLGRVASKVRRQKRYPRAALRKKKGGTAVVAFSITKRGTVTGVRLKRRSGNAALDREVLNMVRRAAPFPPIPNGTGRSRIALSIPVRFAVR